MLGISVTLTKTVFVYLCIWVFEYLCICVFVYLCIWVFVYLCICIPVYSCIALNLDPGPQLVQRKGKAILKSGHWKAERQFKGNWFRKKGCLGMTNRLHWILGRREGAAGSWCISWILNKIYILNPTLPSPVSLKTIYFTFPSNLLLNWVESSNRFCGQM